MRKESLDFEDDGSEGQKRGPEVLEHVASEILQLSVGHDVVLVREHCGI